jgi:tricorn protease-like protein
MKISCDKEIHLLNKKVNIKELHAFIQESFKKATKNYVLTYLDSDGDQISLVSDDDIKTLYETSKEKFVKVLITPST